MSYFDIGYIRSFVEKAYLVTLFEWIGNLRQETKEIAATIGVSPGAIAGIIDVVIMGFVIQLRL